MAADTGKFGRLLAPADTSWWHMEQRDNQMAITAVMVFDGRLDFEHVHYIIATRLLKYERFMQKIAEPNLAFAQPMWVRDPDFSINNHLKRTSLPPPAGRRELEELVGRIMSTPLDYERPLWQYTYVDNFEGGSAIIMRCHHCIADGVALVDLLLHLDDGPGSDLPPVDAYRVGTARGMAAGGDGSLFTLPFRAVSTTLRVGSSVLGVAGKLLTMGNDTATPLRGELSAEKRAAWSSPAPLAAIKEAARHWQGTINDVITCAVAGSLHEYLKDRIPMRPDLTLRAVVPVNLREPSDLGTLGNRFGLVWLPLPVGLADPLERLRAVKRTMDEIKRSPEAHLVYGLLGFFGRTTRTAVHLAVQFLGRGATLVFTNVPGPREHVRFCGRRLTELMAWVPQSGRLGVGVSVISYAGELRLGVASDAALVQDPTQLVQAYDRSLGTILDHAGAHVALSAVS